ncbi:MAG: TonB-dependent receptor plug domain-containing protein, partial [Deltaproteobacteria bacterium]|nr:TonB-dependent receptor plug domain-containing protein [Deltaproteobacteria bacterium]
MKYKFGTALLLVLFLVNTGYSDDSTEQEKLQVHKLPEVRVTAPHPQDYTTLPERDLIERPITESPGLDIATSVIGRKEIEEQNPYSIVDAMNYISGAWTETRGKKIKQFFSVRGQRYPYPGYLIDGAWFREFHEINYYLSAVNFDRIEILRSSSALLLGPGGLTGMVNLVPRVYEQKETYAEGIYGTHNNLRGNLAHGGKGENYHYGLGIGYFHTDGASGRNAMENMMNLYGRVQYRLNSDLEISWSNYLLRGDRELQLALPPASKTNQIRMDSFDPMETYVTVAKLRYQSDKGQATELISNYGSKRFDGHRAGSQDWLENEYEYGATIIHSRELRSNNILRITGLFHRWVTPTGKRFYVGNPGDIRTYSGAIVDEHDFGGLVASIGYRYTREHIKEFGGFNVEGTSGPLSSVKIDDEWSDPLHAVNLGGSIEVTESISLLGNISWGQLAAQPGMLD